MVQRKAKNIILEDMLAEKEASTSCRRRAYNSSVENTAENTPSNEYFDSDDLEQTNNFECRLTLKDDLMDIRYGMLLKYFPKGGVLHLPHGTCETGYYVAANKHITKVFFPNSMKTIGHGSFFHCEDLTSLVFSDNITYIEAMAFSECKNLCEVVLNSGLKEIGRKAFAGCKALCAITIPKSVTYIGPDAFKDCVNLSYVRMPNKTRLNPTAFTNCHIDLKFEYY